MPHPPRRARLALENGLIFTGSAFGDETPRVVEGEVCFNTALSGYQEVLTDPSYAGQIVAMTCPQIGNYGVNDGDLESDTVHVRGFVVRELAARHSNYRATQGLSEWLAHHGVVGVSGIDTRALTKTLRVAGALNGVVATDDDATDEALVERARAAVGLAGANLAAECSRGEAAVWDEGLGDWAPLHGASAYHAARPSGKRFRVVALDCGAKRNILRHLTDQGCEVVVLPWNATPDEVRAHEPDGLFVSNGPGDPAAVGATIAHLRELVLGGEALPTFGICLGHQLLALALGATTYKLKFGHRGANHPIQNLGTGKVEITSQNHGFAVDTQSLEKVGGEPTHVNLNDGTLAGFRHKARPIFAVQYHPEASPGPHDARYLFDCFEGMMATGEPPSAGEMDGAQRARNELVGAGEKKSEQGG